MGTLRFFKQEGDSGPESLACTMCTGLVQKKGNDLNHLVEGNQAGLFRSIVFEGITSPSPLPPPHTNIFYIPNIKALALVVSDKKVFSCFS